MEIETKITSTVAGINSNEPNLVDLYHQAEGRRSFVEILHGTSVIFRQNRSCAMDQKGRGEYRKKRVL